MANKETASRSKEELISPKTPHTFEKTQTENKQQHDSSTTATGENNEDKGAALPRFPIRQDSDRSGIFPNLLRLSTISEKEKDKNIDGNCAKSVPTGISAQDHLVISSLASPHKQSQATQHMPYPETPYSAVLPPQDTVMMPPQLRPSFPYTPVGAYRAPGEPKPAFFIWPPLGRARTNKMNSSPTTTTSSNPSPIRRQGTTISNQVPSAVRLGRRPSNIKQQLQQQQLQRQEQNAPPTRADTDAKVKVHNLDGDVSIQMDGARANNMGGEGFVGLIPQQRAQIEPPGVDMGISPSETEITVEWEHETKLEAKRWRAELPRRIITALVGGVAVIVPMVIMSLDPSTTKSLITSSVAITIFGLLLAWASTADEASLLVATAGYAAVLAVFVAETAGTAANAKNSAEMAQVVD